MKTVIHWFRRDLRLRDNTALLAARRTSEQIVPVYVLSDWRKDHAWTGSHRQQFLCENLADLAKSTKAKGGRLLLRQGEAVAELARLARESKAEAIFFNRDPDPFGRSVEEHLERWGRQHGVEISGHHDATLLHGDELMTKTGGPFRVFTPYCRAWGRLDKPAPAGIVRKFSTPSRLNSLPLPSLGTWGLAEDGSPDRPGGETAARHRLRRFLQKGLSLYEKTRNDLLDGGTSRLSQDLRWGLVSIRELHAGCKARENRGRSSVVCYVRELAWREFCFALLWHFPEVLRTDFNPRYRSLEWSNSQANFRRWTEGATGFPIVDAAMRQLASTGYLPNRARLIVAMFLTKDLQIHWKLGEGHFMRQLIDGEIANNNLNWQWCAGTGADAAPYFRIHNPWTQGIRYDPKGEYIRTWLPELRDVPAKKLFAPPPRGETLARGYPAPMVDHAEAREKTLKMFLKARRAQR